MVDDRRIIRISRNGSKRIINEYEFPGDDTPIITGSALKALEDPDR